MNLKKWLGLSLGLHVVAGIQSIGFNDMDEHFQILEFLAYRMGRGVLADMPYEYAERCRSFFMPALFEPIAHAWLALGVESPAVWAASFRVLTAVIGWASLVAMCLWAQRRIASLQTASSSASAEQRGEAKTSVTVFSFTVVLSALLYFLPYLHARPSGESLGGSFFFLGLASFFLLELDRHERAHFTQALAPGFLAGLGFLCRFQTGFAIAGFGAWCLWRKVRWKNLGGLGVGFAVALGIGALTDYYGFGEWIFSPWRYFNTSFLKGVANSTGIMPWYDYLKYLGYDVPILGYLIGICVAAFWIFNPQSPLTWVMVPFFVLHSLVGHKEPRYMYPMISALPFVVASGYERLRHTLLKDQPVNAYWPLRPFKWLVLMLNFAGLVAATLKPARTLNLLHDYVFEHRAEIHEVHMVQSNPFEAIGIPMHFYIPVGLKLTPTATFAEAERAMAGRPEIWMTYPNRELPSEAGALRARCELRYSVFPEWLNSFNFLPGIRNSANRTSIFRCTG